MILFLNFTPDELRRLIQFQCFLKRFTWYMFRSVRSDWRLPINRISQENQAAVNRVHVRSFTNPRRFCENRRKISEKSCLFQNWKSFPRNENGNFPERFLGKSLFDTFLYIHRHFWEVFTRYFSTHVSMKAKGLLSFGAEFPRMFTWNVLVFL